MQQTTIIAAAPNGAYKQRNDHPAVPLNLEEIVDCAEQVCKASASLFHLHIREDDGRHSLNPSRYLRTIEAIKHRIGEKLAIQITSEAGRRYSPTEQFATIRAVQPECVSIAIREIMPNENDQAAAADFFDWLSGTQIAPQYILYDAADLNRFQALLEKQIIPDKNLSVLFVLGRYSKNQSSSPVDLEPFLDVYRLNKSWMACAFGPTELDCVLAAAAAGGHMRIGFENNLYLSDGQLAESNTALITQAHQALTDAGYQAANAQQARKLLGINQ